MSWLLLMALAFGAPEMIPEEDASLEGRTAPTFAAPLLGGGQFDLADMRGKRVVLAFWASWCGPCRQELPALAELQKTRDDVVIYAVNVDRTERDAQKFLAKVKVDLPIIWDNESVAMGGYNVLSMPTMFLLDENGTVKLRKTGYSAEAGLTLLIDALDGETHE